MNEAAEYDLGKVARTLIYTDAMRVLLFTFDVGPAQTSSGYKSTLYLSDGALLEIDGKFVKNYGDTDFERGHLETARQRVETYATLRGFQVLTNM